MESTGVEDTKEVKKKGRKKKSDVTSETSKKEDAKQDNVTEVKDIPSIIEETGLSSHPALKEPVAELFENLKESSMALVENSASNENEELPQQSTQGGQPKQRKRIQKKALPAELINEAQNTLQTPSPSVPVTTPSTPVENKQQEIIQQQPLPQIKDNKHRCLHRRYRHSSHIAKSKDLFREDSAHSSHRIGTARIMQEITMGKTKTRIINKRLSLSRNLSRDHTISMEY